MILLSMNKEKWQMIFFLIMIFQLGNSRAAGAIAFDKIQNIYYSCADETTGEAKKCAKKYCEEKSGHQCDVPMWSSVDSPGWSALARHDQGVIASWGMASKDGAIADALAKCMNKNPSKQCKLDLTFFDDEGKSRKSVPVIRKKVLVKRSGGEDEGSKQYYSMQGTAIAINSEGFIITNNHVLNGAINCQYIPENQSPGIAKLIRSDSEQDLAILKMDRNTTSFVTFSESDPAKGEIIYAIGYPRQQELATQQIFTDGVVSATAGYKNNLKWIQHTAALQTGNSGGANFDINGNISGINVAFLATAQSVNFSIKPSTVKKMLDAYEIKYTTGSPSTNSIKSIQQIIKSAESHTMKIVCLN
jgi:S1-C subfamily serine protease